MNNLKIKSSGYYLLTAFIFLLFLVGNLPAVYAYTWTTVNGSSQGVTCNDWREDTAGDKISVGKSCTESDNYSSEDTAFTANAMPGKLEVSGSYGITGRSDLAANLYSGEIKVSARHSENLTIISGPLQGAILVDVTFSGSTNGLTRAPAGQMGGSSATAISGSIKTGQDANSFTPFITLGENSQVNDTVTMRLPIDQGVARLDFRLLASASCRNIRGGNGSSCGAEVSSSATVVSGKVVDHNGTLVESAVVMSDSGFDYLRGHPLPATYIPVEVALHTSCLSGNGRLDANLLNISSATSLYELRFEGLNPRQRRIDFEDWGRIRITGRPDGDHTVVVTRDGETIVNETLNFNCDETAPEVGTQEVTVLSACRGATANKGQVFFQMVNSTGVPRPYIIEFENLPNRSTTAAAFGQAIRGTTGRPDGSYNYRVRTGSTEIDTGQVTVDCN